jgi:hypothetical protein
VPFLGKAPQLDNCVVSFGPILKICEPFTIVTMFRMVECVLELDAGEVWAQAAMKKRFPLAAFRDGTFAIEHIALAGLASRAVRLLLPFAYPAVCAAHADLLFVHFSHFLNCPKPILPLVAGQAG